jgi:hypothetical protein
MGIRKRQIEIIYDAGKKFLTAKNSLTQRGIGPVSYATV